MSDRYKYAKNGIYKCENFVEQVEQDRFPEYELRSIGGISGWCFKCTLIAENDQVFLYPSVSCDENATVLLRTFFNVLKKDGSSGSMERRARWNLNLYACHAFTDPFDVSELLNPENEYLDDDGSLSIEYGFHVNAILDDHKIWKFNFCDIVFSYTGDENQMVKCTFTGHIRLELYCSTEILTFHCPQLVEQSPKTILYGVWSDNFVDCLQILHGVRLQISYCDFFDILKVAHFFNLSNVIRYCDQFSTSNGYYQSNFISFDKVIKFNLRHTLTEKLRNLELKDVVKEAKNLDFKEATGEAMKTFVAKILYN